MVNLRVHLRAVEREQTHSVSFPEYILLAICHVEGFFLLYLPCNEGGSSESQGLFQGTIWERTYRRVVNNYRRAADCHTYLSTRPSGCSTQPITFPNTSAHQL